MVWINFQEVHLYGEKSGKCRCGKRRVRRQKFYQTLNPFNKNSAGVPKNRDEIRDELHDAIVKWKSEPIVCSKCPPLPAPPGAADVAALRMPKSVPLTPEEEAGWAQRGE